MAPSSKAEQSKKDIYQSMLSNISVRQGCTNYGRPKFYMIVRNIFSNIIVSPPPQPPNKKICFSSHIPSTNRQVTVGFTGNSRTVSPQYGTCFTSAFSRLEFEDDFLHSWKMCAPLKYVASVFPTISISDSVNKASNKIKIIPIILKDL